jgi:hypothetical protein
MTEAIALAPIYWDIGITRVKPKSSGGSKGQEPRSSTDIGAYEGYYAFHLEHRGAQFTAADYFALNWPNDPSLKILMS